MCQYSPVNYRINMDRAVEAIRTFNSTWENAASDYLVYRQFATPVPGSLAETAARIVLLDKLWATQLSRTPGTTERIIDRVGRNLETIERELSSLGDSDLVENADKVCDAAAAIFDFILCQDSGKRQPYSLASKFYHWCTRVHFPIMDSWAREAIRKFQVASGVSSRERIKSQASKPHIPEYRTWILFYSDLLRSLDKNEQAALLKADWDSLPPDLRLRNSLLRVLDKVFCMQASLVP